MKKSQRKSTTRKRNTKKKSSSKTSSKKFLKLGKQYEKCVEDNCGHIMIQKYQKDIMHDCNFNFECVSKKDKKYFEKVKAKNECIQSKCKDIEKKYFKEIDKEVKTIL